MVDSKHFSTSTVTREIRQRKVVAKAKGVPKLLLVQRETVFFDYNSILVLRMAYEILVPHLCNYILWQFQGIIVGISNLMDFFC